MNKKTLNTALQILKSQKLIDRYAIEIVKKDLEKKHYLVYFTPYKWKYAPCIHFSYTCRYDATQVKNILYNNYIKQ